MTRMPDVDKERRRLELMIGDACEAEEEFSANAAEEDFFDRADREYMELKDGDREG